VRTQVQWVVFIKETTKHKTTNETPLWEKTRMVTSIIRKHKELGQTNQHRTTKKGRWN